MGNPLVCGETVADFYEKKTFYNRNFWILGVTLGGRGKIFVQSTAYSKVAANVITALLI